MRTILTLAVLVSACSAGQTRTRTLAPRDLITESELASITAIDAHEAIARLRPQWLRFRGITSVRDPSAGQLLVYQDGVRLGPVEALRSIRIEVVRALRFVSGPDATMRWGTGHGGGVIEVITK